jgi:hypothetical protein
MRQTIYLRVDRRGVQGMTKSLPGLYKDEIIVKLNVEVADKAFGVPTIEQDVVVNDWSSDIDVQDVEFNQNIITAEEAKIIRERRLERMKEILETQGYEVIKMEAK